MIHQSYIPGFAIKTAAGNALAVQMQAPAAAGSNSFQDVLNGAMERTAGAKREERFIKAQSRAIEEKRPMENQKPKIKAYREIASEGAKTAEVRKTEGKEREAVDCMDGTGKEIENEEKKAGMTAEDAVIGMMSLLFGIKPDEFKKILDTAGIAPEQLTDEAMEEIIVKRLSGVLGLNHEEAETVKMVLESVRNATAKVFSNEPVIFENSLPQDPVKESEAFSGKMQEIGHKLHETAGLELSVEKDESTRMKEMVDSLRMKVQELTQRIRENPGELDEKVSGMIQEMVSESAKEVHELLEEHADVKIPEEEPVTAMKDEKIQVEQAAEETAPDLSSQEDDSRETPDFWKKEEGPTQIEVKNQVDSSRIEMAFSQQLQSSEPVIKAVEVPAETPVPRQEILQQVVEKAKVLIQGDKSEMVMELKPDHLGKLSLKVATENGLVVAKFIAESQQVKQVLESNMQLLKDSLEKQGMTVEGFSVSVRQESRSGQENGNREEGRKRNSAPLKVLEGHGMVYSGTQLESVRTGGYNGWSESRINLTA